MQRELRHREGMMEGPRTGAAIHPADWLRGGLFIMTCGYLSWTVLSLSVNQSSSPQIVLCWRYAAYCVVSVHYLI